MSKSARNFVHIALAAALLAFLAPSLAHGGTITVLNTDGNASASSSGFTLSGSEVSQIGKYVQPLSGSTLSFSTGSLASGTLSGSLTNNFAQFNPGTAPFTISGTWNTFSGTLFTGQFVGMVTWTWNGCSGSGAATTCFYALTGQIAGTWTPHGNNVTGETFQILFSFTGARACPTCGNYTGGAGLVDVSGTTAFVTPEVSSLGLTGTGLCGLGLLLRRRATLGRRDS